MMARRLQRAGATAAVLALAAGQACYAYRPIALSAVPAAGGRARVTLTSRGTDELARYLGPNVAVAEGLVSSVGDDGTLVMSVTFVRSRGGIPQPWSGEGQVSIPREYRAGVDERVFLKRQSIVAGGALVALLIASAAIALSTGGAAGAPDAGGSPPPP